MARTKQTVSLGNLTQLYACQCTSLCKRLHVCCTCALLIMTVAVHRLPGSQDGGAGQVAGGPPQGLADEPVAAGGDEVLADAQAAAEAWRRSPQVRGSCKHDDI